MQKKQDFGKAAAQLVLLWQAHGVDALNNAVHKSVLKSCFYSYGNCGFPKESKKASLARIEPPLKKRQPLTSAHLEASPHASAVQWAREKIGACALNQGGASPDINSVLANVDTLHGEAAVRRDLRVCATAAAAIHRKGGDASQPYSAAGFAKEFLKQTSEARRQRVCDHAHPSLVKYGEQLSVYFIDKDRRDEQEARKQAKREAARAHAERMQRNAPPPIVYNQNTAPGYSGGYNTSGSSYITTTPAPTTRFRTCTTTQLGGIGGGNVVKCENY